MPVTDLANQLKNDNSIVPQNITHQSLLSALIEIVLIAAIILSFIYLLYGGIKWITASGDKEGTTKAQQTVTQALIGLAIAFSAWAIIKLLGNFFGIDPINTTIPSI